MDVNTYELESWKVLVPAEKRLDAVVAQPFKQALTEAAEDGSKRIIIDLSNVEFMDSAGLGALVSLHRLIGEEGTVAISGAQSGVTTILNLTQLDRIFQVYDSPQGVVEGVST